MEISLVAQGLSSELPIQGAWVQSLVREIDPTTTETQCSQISSVQLLSRVWLFATPQTATHQTSLSIANSQSLLKLRSIELVMSSNCLILCPPLLLLSSVVPSIRVYSIESVLCIMWPRYWSFVSASILPRIFRVDFLKDWLAWSPCSPRDSQESSPKSQFKNINLWALSFLYGPTLTSIHEYWKNHSFD